MCVIVCASLTISKEMLCQSYLLVILTLVAAAMPPRRALGSPQVPSGDPMSLAAMLAEMQAMQQELAILRQAIPVAPAGATQGAGGGGVPGALSLRVLLQVARPRCLFQSVVFL
jgi:hypothetical protein